MTLPRAATPDRRMAVGIWVATGVCGFVLAGTTTGAHGALFIQAAAVAGILVGLFRWHGLATAGWWAGLTVLGAASALQLVEAGPRVWYQHLVLPWTADTPLRLIAVLILVIQLLLVGVFWRRHAERALGLLTRTFSGAQILALALLMFLTSATVSRAVDYYVQELLVAWVLQVVSLGSVAATIAVLPQETRRRIGHEIARWFEPADETAPRAHADTWAVSTAIIVIAVCAFLVLAVYQRHPHIPDEIAYLFQARYFANGWIAMAAPPIPEAFSLDLMTYEPTRWYSPTPPGWPAALAIGIYFGVPWLVNPILAGLSVLLTYQLVWNLYDRGTARLTLVLLASSPWFVFLGMSYMTHMFSLVCALGAAVATCHLRRGASRWWAVPGGMGLAVLGINRPLEGLIVSGLLGIWVLGGTGRSWKSRVAGLAVLGTTAMLGASLTFPYNRALTGNPTTFPIVAYTDSLYGPGSNALGFGENRGLGWTGLDPFPGHSLLDAAINTNLNVFAVNVELFGWATGSLWVIGALLLLGRLRRQDYWLIITILAVIGVHAFYWFSGGPDFGARYWFLIIIPAVVLTARGVIVLGSRLGTEQGRVSDGRPFLVVACLVVMSATLFIPWRAVDKYYNYRGMRPDIRTLAKRHGFGRSVVLIRGERHPDYDSAALYNPLDLTAPAPIYVWDRDSKTRGAIAKVYSDRPVWIVHGPTISGAGYEVVGGPMTSSELLGWSP